MISATVYKLLHMVGILLVFLALGGVTLHAINGGSKQSNRARRLVAITHGLGIIVILVAGFGLLARTGAMAQGGVPPWAWLKVVIWLVLAGLITVPYRKPEWARGLWLALPLLGALAAYAALYKPL